MLGLVDYQSDGDSEDACESKSERPQAVIQPSTKAVSQHPPVNAARTLLPDAASLLSSSIDSRLLPADATSCLFHHVL